MEGDVMLQWTSLPALLALSGAVLGGVFALLKWFAVRLLADIDKRLSRIDEIETRVDKLLADLPLHYQRREDSVRELAAADERYQKLVERFIASLRDDLVDTKRRLSAIEGNWDEAQRRFQMRDDAIREYTTINAKLDRLYELLARRNHD